MPIPYYISICNFLCVSFVLHPLPWIVPEVVITCSIACPASKETLQINTDASYAATFESDHEQAIDLFRTARNNARFIDTQADEDSSVGMPDLTPGDEESSDSDEESSVGMPDLIDRHDDSSEEDTIQDSIGSPELGSVTESATTAIEDSSVAYDSDGTNESPMIQIENLEMVEEAVPEWHTCLTCVMHGHTTTACTDRRPREASETPRQYIDHRVVMANELRRLGIDTPAGFE